MQKMVARIAVLVMTVALIAPAHAGTRAETIAKLDASIRSDMAKHHIPGLAIAIVGRKVLIWSAGYGFADLDTRRHEFAVAIENWRHDLNIGTVVRTANAILHRHGFGVSRARKHSCTRVSCT